MNSVIPGCSLSQTIRYRGRLRQPDHVETTDCVQDVGTVRYILVVTSLTSSFAIALEVLLVVKVTLHL